MGKYKFIDGRQGSKSPDLDLIEEVSAAPLGHNQLEWAEAALEKEQNKQLGILTSPHNMTAKFHADKVKSPWHNQMNLHQTKREFNFNLKGLKNYRQNGVFK